MPCGGSQNGSTVRSPCLEPGGHGLDVSLHKLLVHPLLMMHTLLSHLGFAGSDIKYQHEWGMNYSHILPTLIVGSMPQDAGDISYLRNHLGVSAILNLQQEKVCHANLLHGVISNICCWQAALTKLCAFDRTGKSLT
mmetsp:Transcript_37883/g.107028  ORF Transcript_37883/g.107028 Transcript_37883/m.107028 type:complete len:137 (+) Transcript_37883:830-1240(+)